MSNVFGNFPFHVLLEESRQLALIQPEEKVPAFLVWWPGKQEHSVLKVPLCKSLWGWNFILCSYGHDCGCGQGSFSHRDHCLQLMEAKFIFITSPQNRQVMKMPCYPLFCRLRMKPTVLFLSFLYQSLFFKIKSFFKIVIASAQEATSQVVTEPPAR